jgi:hypothetical protein
MLQMKMSRPTVLRYIEAYIDHAEKEDPSIEQVWRAMSDEAIAGYFLLCYGTACGGDWVHQSNEGLGECEGWEGFPEDDACDRVYSLVADAVDALFKKGKYLGG